MKYLVLILLLLAGFLAQAKSLDLVMKEINVKLNCKDLVHPGYEVEYRVEGQALWVNILTVLKSCRTDKFYVLRGGKITEPTKNKCEVHAYGEPGKSLHQITCFTKPVAECKKLLSDQLTPELIMEIVNKDLREVEVE